MYNGAPGHVTSRDSHSLQPVVQVGITLGVVRPENPRATAQTLLSDGFIELDDTKTSDEAIDPSVSHLWHSY